MAVILVTAIAPAARASKTPNSQVPVLEPSPYRVRVLLSKTAGRHRLHGFDLRFARGRDEVFVTADRNTRWEIDCSPVDVRLRDGRTGRVHRVTGALQVSSPAGFVMLDGHPVREELRVHPGAKGCEVVNRLDLEKYLDGLVNAEFSSQWHPEAVDAQVVAARTYALHQIREAAKLPGRNYDLVATEHDQVYGGTVKEDFLAARAVRRTRGLVLAALSAPAAPIKAYYHSSCGGLTELPERVWGGRNPAFVRKVKCGFCDGAPSADWTYRLSTSDLVSKVEQGALRDGTPLGWPADWRDRLKGKTLHRIRVSRWPDNARAKDVTLVFAAPGGLGNGWTELTVTGVRLRSWIGAVNLKSTAFEPSLEPKSSQWVFRGKGYGHGVGMCQWGAKRMGERGYTMASILKHYYPGAVMKKMW